jgi:hypothetical protein
VIDTHGVLQVDDNALKAVPAAVAASAEQACASEIDAAQAAANALQPPATPQELARATAFARCMREHGWPNFPDPDAHGRFTASTPGSTPSSKNDPSFQACLHLVPPRGH